MHKSTSRRYSVSGIILLLVSAGIGVGFGFPEDGILHILFDAIWVLGAFSLGIGIGIDMTFDAEAK